ncbi:MAG: formate hydrogenlyase transcriptional activator [Thermoanaerobaculia bacterium]|jgi:transcriptional regulator with GAF, ATPase, and Fis domain|nr:formate hydrogenlyase transcriptional activator [Thermoanaerobaculia bacterium]
MKNERAESARLHEAFSEVVALSALPAVWSGYRLPQIVADVAEVLLRVLDLEFAYVCLFNDELPIVAARARQGAIDTSGIAATGEGLLVSGNSRAVTIHDPLDATRSLRATVSIGGSAPELSVVAASADQQFPTETDLLLLTVTLNQANTVIGRKRVEELVEENILLRNEIDERLIMGSVIGVSQSMRSVLSNVGKVAPTDATVLITGETGTGKELIAREIHRRSRRAGGPLIAVHSAALPVGLIASELFGHERGAFTGAMQRRIGRFELANRGTIFLDEVGELPPEMQVALLRVLQEHTFERVGGSQTLRTEARVIAATNRDLLKMVREGTFREDLYYRLNVFPIHIPPLRERREDIPVLVEHFTAILGRRLDKPMKRISKATLVRAMDYPWPGNVRELENVIERSVILASGDELVIPAGLCQMAKGKTGRGGALPHRLDELEKSSIEQALSESGGRVGGHGGAAERLGLRPTTLSSKLHKYRIDPARFRPPR